MTELTDEGLPQALEPATTNVGAIVKGLGIPQISRHVFLCADQSNPKCCAKDVSITVWNHLKARLKALDLDTPTAERPSCIFRTKVHCLRVCAEGPIMVIYPDGVWYRNVTIAAVDRIIEEHFIRGQIVEDYLLCQHPLPEVS